MAFALCAGAIKGQKQVKHQNDWQLVWQDEFNGTSPDTSKWNVLIRETSKHNELQYYVPEEVYTKVSYFPQQ